MNGVGKYKVQSSPMSYTAWSSFWSLFRPLAWHDRGKEPHINCHSLNWGGHEWATLTEAREFLVKCKQFDIQIQEESSWVEISFDGPPRQDNHDQ